MFIPPLKIGDIISNAELTKLFKVANMDGMRYSKTYNVLVLISNHYLKKNSPYLNPFDDKWENDGVLYYTGEGKKGNQSLNRQNERLYEEKYDALYLFEVFQRDKYVYQGPMKLAGQPLYGEQHKNGMQPDANNEMRKVWIFPIKRAV